MSTANYHSILPDENTSIEVPVVDVESEIPILAINLLHRQPPVEGEVWSNIAGTSYFTMHLIPLSVKALTDLGDGLLAAADRIFALAEAKRYDEESPFDTSEELTE